MNQPQKQKASKKDLEDRVAELEALNADLLEKLSVKEADQGVKSEIVTFRITEGIRRLAEHKAAADPDLGFRGQSVNQFAERCFKYRLGIR